MTAIWRNEGAGWSTLAPVGFPNEAALHSLVEQAPQLLPLAGNPRLTIVGKEFLLGNGYADLLAVETSGRLVVIEVKLAKNSEARRAVVAQVLTYAAFLRGMDVETLERSVLGQQLQSKGHATLADAVESEDQEGSFDTATFKEGLTRSLADGRFRLVLVLDDVPDELVRLVGYLASIAEKVLIDLITVSAYEVGQSQILVPQRVDPEYQPEEVSPFMPQPQRKGVTVDGSADFAAAAAQAKEEHRTVLEQLLKWADALEAEGLVRLFTVHTRDGNLTLLPYLKSDNAGLVTIWNDASGGYLQFWRSVFERRAPVSLERVEKVLGDAVKRGNCFRNITDELLSALTDAYREAALGRISQSPTTSAPA